MTVPSVLKWKDLRMYMLLRVDISCNRQWNENIYKMYTKQTVKNRTSCNFPVSWNKIIYATYTQNQFIPVCFCKYPGSHYVIQMKKKERKMFRKIGHNPNDEVQKLWFNTFQLCIKCYFLRLKGISSSNYKLSNWIMLYLI